MKIFPEPAERPLTPPKLSIFCKEPVSPSLPVTRVFIKSKPNSPLLLTILSSDPKSAKIFSFTAGEKLKHQIEKTNIKDLLPNISKFELFEGQAELSFIIPIGNQAIRQCRICLEIDQQEDLITPCLCKGSQEFVHQNCLKMWLLRSEKSEKELTYCEVCRGNFKMTFTYSAVCTICGQYSFKFWIPMILLLGLVSTFLTFYLNEGSFKGIRLESRIFLYSFLGLLSLLALLALIIFRNSLCSSNKVTEWEILNHN